MTCIPRWGAHGVLIGAGLLTFADRDKRQGGNTPKTNSKPQATKDTRKGGKYGAGGNTRGR